jgi:hypothetical protein
LTGAILLYLIAALFGAALAFLQVFFESRGDIRSLLLHRPISRSRIFLSKVIAGVGLLVISIIGKLAIGEWFAAEISYDCQLDRQGRVLIVPWKIGTGPTGTVTDLEGQVPPDLEGKWFDRNTILEIEAPLSSMDWPLLQSYRNPGRCYVECGNDSKPGNEAWYFVPDEGRLLGYDKESNAFLGSFGPDGFAPAGQQPGERFQGGAAFPHPALAGDSPRLPGFPRRRARGGFCPAQGPQALYGSSGGDSHMGT